MKLKICGMKYNIAEVAALRPDYLGFIFYGKSPRNLEDLNGLEKEIAALPSSIKKVGVFVDTSAEAIVEKINKYNFDVIQLHGSEAPEYCKALKIECPNVEIWKVFSIKDSFDFSVLNAYEPYVDKFLFDTKGKEKGGNGYTFDWSVLWDYPSEKPFILSGGIGVEEMDEIRKMQKSGLPLHAIDVNSKFETAPGVKNIQKIEKFNESMFK